MEETYLLNHPGVKKKILAGGTGPLPHFPPGTKLVFHFRTLLDNFEQTVIDDSRLAGRPAEIFVGKMFKMEVWETLLTSMRLGEVAEFWCDAVHTGLYPIVSKGMRLIAQGKDPLEGQRHMCGMGNLFHYHSTGFPELDELMRTPQPLTFIMELLQVGDPMSYHRESWMMEKDEKLQAVPVLHMQGNALVKQKEFREAASKYKEAVLLLKTVQSREKPGDIDYVNLGRMIIPLELNYCQCMLELEEYYEVIEHTTELLEKHKDCVKGYYKRAKAHAAVWNEKEARRDFNMVANLDITLASLVNRELKVLSERMKEKYWKEKESYWNMLEKTKNGEEEKEDGHDDTERLKQVEDISKEIGNGDDVQRVTTDEKVREKGEESPSSSAGVTSDELRGSTAMSMEKSDDAEESSCSEIGPNISAQTEEKDWQQMLRLVMLLQKEGNFLIKEKRHEEASAKFKEALEYVDVLQNKQVDPQSEDGEALERVRLPLTLNLCQCLLELQQYQQVVTLNDKVLKKHQGNFKAVYQRARAHAALYHEVEAQRDFAAVERLDSRFKPFVRQELKKLGESMRAVHARQNKTYWDMSEEKWGPAGSKAKAAALKARTKNVKSAQQVNEEKAEMKEDDGETEEKETAEEPAAGAEREENPDVKRDTSRNNETECGRSSGEGFDNENIESAAVQVDEQGAPDNRETDTDSKAAPTSTDEDNALSKRSALDKGRKKVKCQSPAALGSGETSQENDTGNSSTQSEQNNG